MGEAEGDEYAPTKGHSDAATAATTSSSSSMSDVPAKKLARQLDFTGFGGAPASVAMPELPKPQLPTVAVQHSQPKPPVVAVPVPVSPQLPIPSGRPVVRWAKVLIINEETMEAFVEGSMSLMSAPLDNIRKLGIHCSSLKDDLVPAMVSLVRGMTNLNTLYIKTSLDGGDTKSVVSSGFGMGYWKLQNLAFVRQLKEVTIEPSTGSNEIEFAQYILEHSQNLKKIFIFLHHGGAKQSKVAGMLSRSKMISTATIVIRGSGMIRCKRKKVCL